MVLSVECCSLLVCCCWHPRRLSLLFDSCRLQFFGVLFCCLLVAVVCVLSGVLCYVFVARFVVVDWYLLLVVCAAC